MKGTACIVGALSLAAASACLAAQTHTDNERLFAAVIVHAMQSSIDSFESACTEWGSGSREEIRAAVAQWKKENAALLARADAVMRSMGADSQRARLDQDLAMQNAEQRKKIESASADQRLRWCAGYPERLRTRFPNPSATRSQVYQFLMDGQ